MRSPSALLDLYNVTGEKAIERGGGQRAIMSRFYDPNAKRFRWSLQRRSPHRSLRIPSKVNDNLANYRSIRFSEECSLLRNRRNRKTCARRLQR
jgi:hypothetical protein